MLFVCHTKILHKHCFQFLLGVKMASRETENNAYAKFWGWQTKSIMVCYGISGVVIYTYPENNMSCFHDRANVEIVLFLWVARKTRLLL